MAALLRFEREAPDVLLMRRMTRASDRWSGQISFPGGREEQSDADLIETAMRETREEVGVDLRSCARLLGQLDVVRAIAGSGLLPMSITPYVFVQEQAPEIELGEEADAAFWLPLDRAARGELDDVYPYRKGPVTLNMGCWRYEQHIVWGLTYRMLQSLLGLVRE